jgi:hypothetical protein
MALSAMELESLGAVMSSRSLTTYLNDHLAGSVAALELLEHLAGLYRGTEREKLLQGLRGEIEQDQKVLQQVLDQVGGKESRVRKAAAWLTEKIGEAKLKLDDPGDGELRVLEALESVGLGIQGKLALWRALAATADRLPQLENVDFDRLQRRAAQQYERVETQRIEVARIALVP